MIKVSFVPLHQVQQGNDGDVNQAFALFEHAHTVLNVLTKGV